jgi:ubiquitin-like protein Pup
MAEQEKRQAPAPAETEQVSEAPKTEAKQASMAGGLDDILDEIDEVLETNAEEFVKSYVQKGGQ